MTELMTVIETDTFARDARRVFTDDELAALIYEIAANPEAGTQLPETGGVRYIRVAAKGHGKGRGARVVYFYTGRDLPVFLLACYFKGRKDRITAEDRRTYRRLAEAVLAAYGKG